MRLSGRLLLAFFPDRRLRGTPWAEAWRGRERRTVRMLSRVALVATPVTYVLHHFFVDRALGLDSSPRWIIARFGGAAFGLLLFGATFWPAGGTSRWFRLPLIIAGISASLLQVLTMTWYAGVPYHYAVIIPFLVSILLQVSAPLSGLYMALVYAVEWPLLVASGARMPFVVSAMAVATIVAVSLRARMSADVDAFIVQRRLDALNAELEQRVREQVREQVAERSARTREVEVLNDQLRLKVKERSRELERALRRLSERGADQPLFDEGEWVGDRLRIVGRIGAGGMGTVYRAEDTVSGGPVAVKVMRLASGGNAETLRRFLAEAALSSAVAHSAIVRTLHVDVTPDGRVYQIMELVSGVTLAQRIDRGATAPGEVARLGAVAASALAAAHAAGVVHRDIKPSNLMACAGSPGLRVLDFGISKILSGDAGEGDSRTRTHQLIGTPAYMAPEQLRSAAGVTGAADIYSLGRSLYEMLIGKAGSGDAWFGASDSDSEGARRHELEGAARDAPASLVDLVLRCLSTSAALRPSADEVAQGLKAIADQLAAPRAEDVGRAVVALVMSARAEATARPEQIVSDEAAELMVSPTAATEDDPPQAKRRRG